MYLDPIDPLNRNCWSGEPGKDFDEDEAFSRAIRFQTVLLIAVVVVLSVLFLFTGCTVTRQTSSAVESHRVETMIDTLDSLMRLQTVVQQDSAWRESVMRQFQSIREKSDTSRSVVLNAAGDTVRERIIINNVRETSSETDRLEREVLMQRLETMDSSIRLMRQQLSHSDSLLQQRETVVEKPVPADLSWWQQARIWLANLILVALAVAAAVWLVRKRAWWLPIIRKLF